MVNSVKKKLSKGQAVTGCFIGFPSPTVVEMLGYAGFDFVVIDNEHSSLHWGDIEEMVRAAELTGIVPIVRVSYDPSDIQKVMDRGALGLHVPMVNTKEQAEEVVRRAKFPPDGKRGAAYSCRSAKFGKRVGAPYFQQSNDEVLITVHIETKQAVDNIEEIMSVPGIDVCYIGPTDLSVTMGYGAEGPDHPEVQKAMNQVLEAGKKHGVAVGIQAGLPNEIVKKRMWGAPYIGVSLNSVMYQALEEAVQAGKMEA